MKLNSASQALKNPQLSLSENTFMSFDVDIFEAFNLYMPLHLIGNFETILLRVLMSEYVRTETNPSKIELKVCLKIIF